MERTAVQKLARVLRAMVIIVFFCNLAVLFFIPGMVLMQGEWMNLTPYEDPLELPVRLLIVLRGAGRRTFGFLPKIPMRLC